ncbi:MAG TPA: hypothetical protein VMV86_01980 [Methanosarcinales archaeon]|nr:hypothetical protein [Methanosarcinales archaeon]
MTEIEWFMNLPGDEKFWVIAGSIWFIFAISFIYLMFGRPDKPIDKEKKELDKQCGRIS